MKIRLLIGQYRSDYPDQHAPTVFAAADEFLLGHPDYWIDLVAKAKEAAGDEVEAWAEIFVEVPMTPILDALYRVLRECSTVHGGGESREFASAAPEGAKRVHMGRRCDRTYSAITERGAPPAVPQ